MMISGTVTTVPAAMTAVYGSWCGWEPVKLRDRDRDRLVLSLLSWLAMQELVPRRDERQDRRGEETRRGQRQDHLPERLPGGAAVDPGRLLELPRHLAEERGERVDRQRQHERDVRDDQRLVGADTSRCW